MTMRLDSSALRRGEQIPQEYTCDGGDVSPPLNWSGAPADTRSFALIVDDPDAPSGDWVHWVVYDLPAGTTSLSKGGPLPDGAHVGRNDFGKTSYGGPCPPPGKPHRYFFRLYALDQKLELPEGTSRQDLLSAMKGHVLEQSELFGTFGH